MKRWYFAFLLAVTSCLAGYAQQAVDDDYEALSAEDQELIESAVKLVDSGMNEAATTDFDYLFKKYPKNYLVAYERLYNLYLLRKYDVVAKEGKKLLKHKHSTEGTYQLVGNAYDMLGEPREAIKIYEQGLKRFPGSGSLYLEIGNVLMMHDQPDEALKYYNTGIVAQPNFASNYFRGAQLYFNSEAGKAWGLMYAETEILLAPSKEARHKEMAEKIVDCFKEVITISDEGKKTSVELTPAMGMSIDNKTNVTYLDFPGIYEGCMLFSLMNWTIKNAIFTCSLSDLIELRSRIVDSYFALSENGLYGDAMYLLVFQKKVKDAGHWDAYNYFLFEPVFPDEFEEWYGSNSDAFDAFVDWYNNDTFSLGEGRSVDPAQIYRYYQPIDLMKAMMIQAKLSGLRVADNGEDEKEVNEDE